MKMMQNMFHRNRRQCNTLKKVLSTLSGAVVIARDHIVVNAYGVYTSVIILRYLLRFVRYISL